MPLSKDSISLVVEEASSSGLDSSSRLLLLNTGLPGAPKICVEILKGHPKKAFHQTALKGIFILLASSQHYCEGLA